MYIHMVQVEYQVFFNIPLQEHLELTVILILIILFWSRNTSVILFEFPQKII
jgi:hypothetical protein